MHRAPSPHRFAGLALLPGVILTAINLFSFRDPRWVVDDAWIAFRIARNWLEHGVLTFDAAMPPVEGMSNLLWTIVSASWIGGAPTVDPATVARVVGAGLHLVTVVVLARLAARLAPDRPGITAATTSLLLAGSWSLAYWAMSAMETPLYGLLFAISLDRLQRYWEGRKHAGWSCGLALGLLGMTRPEGILVGLVVSMVQPIWLRPWSWRRFAGLIVPFAAVVAGMEAFRLATYGSLIPNTYWAKPPDPQAGLVYLGTFALLGVGLLSPLGCWPSIRGSRLARLAAVVALVAAAGTAWTGGDWMPGYRRLTVPLLSIALMLGASVGFARGRWRWIVGLGAVLMIGAQLGAVLWQGDLRYHRGPIWAEMGRRAAGTPGVTQVALADVGNFGYQFRGSVFDLLGLTDRHLARLPGVHGGKPWDEAYFRRRHPDLVLLDATTEASRDDPLRLRSVERAALRSINNRGGYTLGQAIDLNRAISPEFRLAALVPTPPRPSTPYLLVFVRQGLELPPRLWGNPPDPGWHCLLRATARGR